ncbi:hypothetical protein VYU27_001760 [Nannochloropsis oceanica]
MKTSLVTLALAAVPASAFMGGFMGKNFAAPTKASPATPTTMFLNFGKKGGVSVPKPAGKAAPAKVTPKRAAAAVKKAAPVKKAAAAAVKKAAPVKKAATAAVKKAAPVKKAATAAVKKAVPVKKVAAPLSNPDFAGGLIGSDVEAIRFDPWNLAAERDPEGLAWYRSAELKHGRICMLAALGLFVQSAFHLPDDVFSNPKGLDALFQVSAERPQAIAQILIAIGAIEVAGLAANEGKAPGDFGFDPLNLAPKTEDAFNELQLKEIKNGRLAMVSVAGMLIQEALTNQGVLEQINSGHLSPFNDGQGAF